MPIHLKSDFDLAQMRIAADLTRQVLDMIDPHIQPGVTTLELDQICHSFIVDELDAIPAPLNYRGFPKSICTSVNHVICHGIPGGKRLKNGDIINVDITVYHHACKIVMRIRREHLKHDVLRMAFILFVDLHNGAVQRGVTGNINDPWKVSN